MTSSVEVEDLSGSLRGRAQKERQQARIAAARGVDVLLSTPACWLVCSLCDLPTTAFGGMSVCCCGPMRVHGWTL